MPRGSSNPSSSVSVDEKWNDGDMRGEQRLDKDDAKLQQQKIPAVDLTKQLKGEDVSVDKSGKDVSGGHEKDTSIGGSSILANAINAALHPIATVSNSVEVLKTEGVVAAAQSIIGLNDKAPTTETGGKVDTAELKAKGQEVVNAGSKKVADIKQQAQQKVGDLKEKSADPTQPAGILSTALNAALHPITTVGSMIGSNGDAQNVELAKGAGKKKKHGKKKQVGLTGSIQKQGQVLVQKAKAAVGSVTSTSAGITGAIASKGTDLLQSAKQVVGLGGQTVQQPVRRRRHGKRGGRMRGNRKWKIREIDIKPAELRAEEGNTIPAAIVDKADKVVSTIKQRIPANVSQLPDKISQKLSTQSTSSKSSASSTTTSTGVLGSVSTLTNNVVNMAQQQIQNIQQKGLTAGVKENVSSLIDQAKGLMGVQGEQPPPLERQNEMLNLHPSSPATVDQANSTLTKVKNTILEKGADLKGEILDKIDQASLQDDDNPKDQDPSTLKYTKKQGKI